MNKTMQLEEQIFLAALELEFANDRVNFVTQRCNGDSGLRDRVLELLEFHDKTGNILDITTDGLGPGDHVEDDSIRVGTQIGPYKLLQAIGTGGMGVVYMAEQSEPVRRKVAIKIIKLGLDTRNVIARFEAERQALAMMDHPNITKVFDAGRTESGRPYFVMELVSGESITRYCDKNRLSLRDRLELFHKVCNGIQHAHQKGIIHRDLKPSNIMVTHYDGVPIPKIIDFGIAKAVDKSLTDKTLFTSYGNMVGTPEYMSPEQAEFSGLDIDTRSDVYSLGVLLYELLTGTTPFYKWKKKGLHRFCEAICREEPELASTRVNNLADTVKEITENRNTDIKSLNRLLRGDIDWILVKCMAKDRNQRYETAADLARDVQRHLNGQPIEAAGPNVGYRMRKYIRKHSGKMAIAAMFLISLIGATIVSAVFAVQANQARILADSRLTEVDEARREAEAERDRAIAAEEQLQELNEQIGNEAATAAASLRYIKKFPDSKFSYRFPAHGVFDAAGVGNSIPAQEGLFETSISGNMQRIDGDNKTEINVFSSDDQTFATKSDDSKFYKISIANCGDMKVTSTGNWSSVNSPSANGAEQNSNVILIEDEDCTIKTHEFLNILADEQSRRFGKDHQRLANTLYELGAVALKKKDWECAEKNFQQSRDILRKHAQKDERLAKVEMLLSRTLLNQKKLIAAKQTMIRSMAEMRKLKNVPPELNEFMEELKIEMSNLEIPNEEFLGELNTKLGPMINGAIEKLKPKANDR